MKKIIYTLVLVLLLASTFSTVAYATIENESVHSMDEIFKRSFEFKPPLIKSNPPATGEVSIDSVNPIPPEKWAAMSKEEQYKLMAIPGYFTPQQLTAPKSLLLNNPQPVLVNLIVDEEMRAQIAAIYGFYDPTLCPWELVYSWGNNILEGGDDPFETTFGIDFQLSVPAYWYSPNGSSLEDLYDIVVGYDPAWSGCDITILMTGQPTGNPVGLGQRPGNHFVMHTNTPPLPNVFQHEASHNFNATDHPDPWDFTDCVMCYNKMLYTRNWCNSHTTVINDNKFRFD